MGVGVALFACAYSYFLPNLVWTLLLPLFALSVMPKKWTAMAMVLCWVPTSFGGILQPWVGIMIPPPPPSEVQGLRWVLTGCCLAMAAIRTVPTEKKWSNDLLVASFLYVLALGAIALTTSELPKLSFTRVMVWGAGLFAVYKCLEPLEPSESRWLLSFYLSLLGTFLVLSLAGRYLPGARIGFDLFLRGIFSHSQTLGAVAAALSAYLICQMFMRNGPLSIGKSFLLLLPMLLTLHLSHSRTAIIALALGVLIGLIVHRGRGSLGIDQSATTFYICLGFVALALVVTTDASVFDSFVNKHGAGGSFFESLFSTRYGLVVKQLRTFIESPIFGSGFGLPALPANALATMDMGADSVSTEKGFLPTAVLQEMGMVGFLITTFFIYLLCRHIGLGADPRLVAVAATSLFSNLGESTFFSFGGTGYFHWIFVLLAVRSRNWGYIDSPSPSASAADSPRGSPVA